MTTKTTTALRSKIDELLDGKKKRTTTDKPFFVVERTIPADAIYRDKPHPQAGETVTRGACLIGHGQFGHWFVRCELNDDGSIKRKGRIVKSLYLDEWTLVQELAPLHWTPEPAEPVAVEKEAAPVAAPKPVATPTTITPTTNVAEDDESPF